MGSSSCPRFPRPNPDRSLPIQRLQILQTWTVDEIPSGRTVNEIPSTPHLLARALVLAAPSRLASPAPATPQEPPLMSYLRPPATPPLLDVRLHLSHRAPSCPRPAPPATRDDTARPRPAHLLRPQLRRVEVFQRLGIWVHPAPPAAWTWSWEGLNDATLTASAACCKSRWHLQAADYCP